MLTLAVGLACEPAARGPAPPRVERSAGSAAASEPPARERVFFPRGACTTAWIEVQVFEPGRGWVPHPEHPRIRAGEIHAEEASRLLDLRVRCIDLAGKRSPSPWLRGVELEPRAAGSNGRRGLP